MKRIIAIAALLAAASSLAVGQTPDKKPMPAGEKATPAGVEQELTRLTDKYVAALKGKDAAELDRLWADDLTFITPGGAVQTKAQRLADIKSGATSFDTLEPGERAVPGHAGVGAAGRGVADRRHPDDPRRAAVAHAARGGR